MTTTACPSYLRAVRELLTHIEQTQLPAVERAADLMVGAITNKGAVYCAEIGHGIHGDFIGRAGGLAAVQAFSHSFTIKDHVARVLQNRPHPESTLRDLEEIRLAVRGSNLCAGDVMLIGSVSGRSRRPVELALACREKGVKTIGLTALAYTREIAPAHPSGRKLCDAVDVVIDIGAPYGDAAVEIPGYEVKLLPVSGVANAVTGHLIFGSVMEKMARLGQPATVFMSVNRDGGSDAYQKAVEQYEARGY
jgi:uncharacterized phosphosugar-binding protein